jgi:hypothetical protein
MRRGTTPTHTFRLPFDTSSIKELFIIYAQSSHLTEAKVVKSKEECTLHDDTVTVTLSQEDTLSLSHSIPVKIQVRVLTHDNKALASKVIERSVKPCLDDEVMG